MGLGFSFTSVKKVSKSSKPKTKTATNKVSINLNTVILQKKVEGVVFININGNYHVNVDDDNYTINPENYYCLGVTQIFEQVIADNLNRVKHVRDIKDTCECNRDYYLPFIAGCKVKGHIVKDLKKGITFFDIKKVSVDMENPTARYAIRYYRDNYDEIQRNKQLRKENNEQDNI